VDAVSYGPLTLIVGATLGLAVGLGWSWSTGKMLGRAGQAGDVAALVAVGASAGGAVRVTLTNLSDRPVFGVVVWLVSAAPSLHRAGRAPSRPFGALAFHVMPMLPPGCREIAVAPTEPSADDAVAGAEIAFSDAGGEHWVRRADGRVEPLASAPWRHYGFPSPVGL
jgi:hypothetical protein